MKKKSTTLLLLAGSSFLSPLILLADVLHSRYLLPAVPFFAIAVGSVLEASYQQLTKQFKAPLVIQCLLFTLFVPSLLFLYQLWTNPISANWVADDESQLFTSWSSGHGIKEVSTLILEESRSTPVAVATEGYFGTLPDGILMYLFGKSGEYYVEGIGQPVREVSGKYARLSQGYEKKWLVVNSHRLDMQLPPELLISEFCRPLSAPCLQLWDVSSIAPTQSKEVLP
ncbi:MAG: hypothetical protein H6774_04035 [Pseudomonadales bacterium]|nr:hypothetical protein [Candidatus Woesebacteria bacterium]MCB9802230.1 hypothetical protein [Pseudomonadales bacterium]